MAGARRPRKKKAAADAAGEMRQLLSSDELRRQAEEHLDGLFASAASASSSSHSLPVPQDPAAVHELRVHQIELEMQNEELRRAQLELEAQREKYFALFDLAPVGYLTLSDEGLVGDANLTAAHLLGVERQDLVGRRFIVFVFAADQDVFYRQDKLLKQTGAPQSCKMRLQPVGPEPFWAHFESRPRGAAADEPIRYHVTFASVQENVLAEEALRESERNYRTFFETVDDVITVTTSDGRLVCANPATSARLGYSAAELSRMQVLDLYPAAKRGEAEAIFAAVSRGERASFPLPLQSKSGALVAVETRVWYGRWDGAECVFGVSKDLTEEEALQKFERLFRSNPVSTALSNLPDQRLPDQRFTDVNDAFLSTLGYTREQVLGRSPEDLGLFVETERLRAVAEQLQAQGRASDWELKVRCKDGAILDGLFSGEIIESQGQRSFLTVMIDQTERKRAEGALLESLALQQSITEGVIAALARTVEVRDPYTAGHQRRVGELAAAMALQMGLGEQAAEGLRVGGMLHDAGKIKIPAEILAKPGLLSTTEFELIKVHAQAGFEILAPIHFPWPVAEMARQHHERQDGSGYPRGLAGEDILPEARILAVADVVEAMASHRPYRPALGLEAALAEVRSGAGVRFDAAAVAACERVFARGFVFAED